MCWLNIFIEFAADSVSVFSQGGWELRFKKTCLWSQRTLLISEPTLFSPRFITVWWYQMIAPAPKTIGCWIPLASDPNLMSHSCRNQYESLCWNMSDSLNHILLNKRDALRFHSELQWKALSGNPFQKSSNLAQDSFALLLQPTYQTITELWYRAPL